MLTLNGLEDVKAHVGEELGVSDWHEVTQEDDQPLRRGDRRRLVDPSRRRARQGRAIRRDDRARLLHPLARADVLLPVFSFSGFAFGVNYGVNRVRFPAPMPVGGKVRMRAKLAAVDDIPGGAQITMELTFEREGGEKPVCVAESLSRVYTG